ncbi:30S ribosome-binding factor RbfA [Desulfobacter postgatei]|jgi:ribosome-binding factor A|uniref:Ribosome-binding factor A n=1 Tax=Desulfobacter postgatei 2ac9 TaxID=879212 RepID=I5AZT9_9BACT|nr:30S ribosome-binding factor RbfA [Desulfobacter postgatei]EIM62752.1 ribosome-binding factor A [Desulfobacter postgatei 2ac9]MDQ1271257.1 ribosome-binding factor [Thermodesulfobacteriota bacterium]MDX9963474.1 30S ribosome-binding factor RbfA [Desulfobacter postgatei]HRF89977.1 30S ribosome-binding factor RbfA [Desulfobacter postgatei]
MKPYTRAERVSIQIQQAITELLSKKMQDPRMEMATISGVKMSPDLSLAYVYVTVFGDKKRIREALKGFQKSKGFIKKRIAPKLGLRLMPDLRFIHDDSFDNAARLDALIDAAPKGENRGEDDMSGALEGSCDHPDE